MALKVGFLLNGIESSPSSLPSPFKLLLFFLEAGEELILRRPSALAITISVVIITIISSGIGTSVSFMLLSTIYILAISSTIVMAISMAITMISPYVMPTTRT